MASSKEKARNRPEKKRITERMSRPGIRSRVKSTRKRANTPYRRQPYESVSIPQLVYELLTIDKYNQGDTIEAKRFSSPERFRTPRQRMQKYHEQRRLPYEAVDHRDSPESVQVPDYVMESRPTSIENLTETMDAANSSAPPSSANSSVSNISMEPITLANSLNSARALFRKRSLVQLVNKYIKAGIEEGKRQAKKYIRKALSFGVRSGYLILDDPQGNVLRVCPTLDTGSWSSRKADAETRQRRRIARRGQIHQTTIDDRKAMRRGIPRDKPRHDADNGQITSRKRYRRHAVQNPARSISTRESSPRKSPGVSKSKPKTIVKRKRIDSTVNNKRRQQRKRGNNEDAKKPVKKRRVIASPKRFANDHEPVEKSYNNVNSKDRDQYKRNEDSYRAVTERRKSSSREDGSRMEKQKAGTSTDDDCNRIERRNADDDEKSEEANVERDTNDTIRQMDP
ncbi:uncharacterized protein [Linepithema humile]|uniref:uncharacterized protein isoform X2 n=1 Tax=Linepithema humile TaxID=83485 RepID=UPI00351EFA4B